MPTLTKRDIERLGVLVRFTRPIKDARTPQTENAYCKIQELVLPWMPEVAFLPIQNMEEVVALAQGSDTQVEIIKWPSEGEEIKR